jgi:hypothetical protein
VTVHNYALFFEFWIPISFFEGRVFQKSLPGFSGMGSKLKRLSKSGKITLSPKTSLCGVVNRISIVTQIRPMVVTLPYS